MSHFDENHKSQNPNFKQISNFNYSISKTCFEFRSLEFIWKLGFGNWKFSSDRLLAIVVFFTSFTVYLLTLAPTIYIEDAAEFAAAVPTLGITHPSGFPLYMLLGKLFTILVPIGEMAWRVNLFSAITTSFALAVFYYALRSLLTIEKNWSNPSKSVIISFICFVSSLTLGFSQIIWHEATYAEVYPLYILFAISFLWCLAKWRETKDLRFIYFLVFLMGLSLANHLSIIVYFPGIAFFILLFWSRKILEFKPIVFCIFLFILPLSLYLYLPIRAAANPEFYFKALNAGSPAGAAESVEQFAAASLNSSTRITQSSLAYFANISSDIFEEFPLIVLIISAAGLFFLFFRDKKLWFAVLVFLGLGSFGVIGGLTHGQPYNGIVWWFLRYFLPYLLIPIAILFAFGLSGIFDLLRRFKLSRPIIAAVIVIVIIIVAPIQSLAQFWKINDKSQYWIAYDYNTQMLDSLPRNAVLIANNHDMNNDIELFSLAYLQIIDKYRTDVMVISDTPTMRRPAGLKLGIDYFYLSKFEQRLRLIDRSFKFYENNSPEAGGERKIFTTFPADTLPDSQYASRSNGIVYQLFEKDKIDPLRSRESEASQPDFHPVSPRNIAADDFPRDDLTRNLVAKILYHSALFEMENNQSKKARQTFLRALEIDLPVSEYYGTYLKRRTLLSVNPKLQAPNNK
ncbi:MAG TPA: DUF2723 domain-containing protein [Patescibacteria group bacterium]|nr:DUF2723 domain-containing protein [Patescibacteria group bacterium]